MEKIIPSILNLYIILYILIHVYRGMLHFWSIHLLHIYVNMHVTYMYIDICFVCVYVCVLDVQVYCNILLYIIYIPGSNKLTFGLKLGTLIMQHMSYIIQVTYLSMYLSIPISIHPSIYPHIYLCIYLPIILSLYIGIHT